MQVHFIINPYAGNGRGIKRWQQFEQQLTIQYTIHRSQYAGHTLLIAKEIAQCATKENPICIIAFGGDGTIHEVLNGALNFENVYIGAVAAGSGNDFARGYETFETVEQVERFTETLNSSLHDYGIASVNEEQRRFINNFGVGFDALVAFTANESKLKKSLNKWRLGKLSYPYYVILALFTYKPFQLAVVKNGEERHFKNVWFATVSNQPYFGGGMNLSPESNTSDGILEVTIVSNLSKRKLLFLFGSVFLAKHTRLKEVHQFSAKDIQLIFDQPVMAHADGEKQKLAHGQNKIQLTVHKKAWKLAK
ncbi:diacylglycerol/lipid kinase family protein [Solibacillus silvestris]|uniref:diacylglycerol/lipid kinase family protein n=1 Tax=Solibacillus silvestris TaxID=76853 RepID=UPI003F7E5F56